MLRPTWKKLFRFNPAFGLALILLFGIPRFIIILQANVSGNYNLVPVIFVGMMITPVILLTGEGRKSIGIKRATGIFPLLFSFATGIMLCVMIFLVAKLLFDNSISNWFVYISRSYNVPANGLTDQDRMIFFLIYAAIGMTFSPVGEEVFYRGIVHESFAGKYGDNKASLIDSLAFALTHLAHFGIVYVSGAWSFLFFPALLWVIFMFIASRLFFFCRRWTGAITGAILSHAGFNAAMMYFIFYHILK